MEIRKLSWILIVILIPSISAFNLTTWNDSSTTGNFTYTTGTEWYTKQLIIPQKSIITGGWLTLMGYESIWYYDLMNIQVNNFSIAGDDSNWNTPIGLSRIEWINTSGLLGGDGLSLRINATYPAFANMTFNYGNSSLLNLSFDFKLTATDCPGGLDGAHWMIGKDGGDYYEGIDIVFISPLMYSYDGANFTPFLAFSCAGTNDWTRISFEINNNRPRSEYSIYVNGTRVLVNMSARGTKLQNLTVLKLGLISGQSHFTYIENLSFGYFNYTSPNNLNDTYPMNVTLILDNVTELFNYGGANSSVLDHRVNVSLASLPNTTHIISFRSNISGILEYSAPFVLFNNTLNITLFDEDTGSSLNGQNISVEVVKGDDLITWFTLTGNILFSDQFDGTYTINLFNSNYSKRAYAQVFSSGQSVAFNAYLANVSSTVVFTFQDETTAAPLENVVVSMARIIDGEWQTVTSKLTDVTGKVQFSYVPNVRYRFTAQLSGYRDKVFYLDPILFTSYLVQMQRSVSNEGNNDYFGVSVVFEPIVFYNDVVNNLTWTISSAFNSLQSYTATVTAPGVSPITYSGSNSAGETFIFNFNISSDNYLDVVNLSYSYTLTNGDSRNYSFAFGINRNVSQGTLIYNRGETYGTGDFERAIIAVLASIIIAGFGIVAGGELVGGVIGILVLGVFSFLGFISFWAVLISMFAAFVLVIGRSE